MGTLLGSFRHIFSAKPDYQYEKPLHAHVLSKPLPADRPSKETLKEHFGDLLETRRRLQNGEPTVPQDTVNSFIPAVQALHSSVRHFIGRLSEDATSFSWAFGPATNNNKIHDLQKRETEETPLSIDEKSELTMLCAEAAQEYRTKALRFLSNCPDHLKTMAAAALTHSACEKFTARREWNGECERLISLAIVLDPTSYTSGDAKNQPVRENAKRVFATLDRTPVEGARKSFLNLLAEVGASERA